MEAWNMDESNSPLNFNVETEECYNVRVVKETQMQEKHTDHVQQQTQNREWLNIFQSNRSGGEDQIFEKNTGTSVKSSVNEQQNQKQTKDKQINKTETHTCTDESEKTKESNIMGCIKCLQ